MQSKLIAAGFVAAAVVVAIFVKNWPCSSSEWAAWVQAVGSLIAVSVAIWVPLDIHRRERAQAEEASRLSDIRRLKAVKAVLVQICILAKELNKLLQKNDFAKVAEIDPQFLVDYKAVLQSLPLFDIPSAELVLYVNTVPRAIDEVTVRLFEARNQVQDPYLRYEWLLANDIEERAENLCNLAMKANNYCQEQVESMGEETRTKELDS